MDTVPPIDRRYDRGTRRAARAVTRIGEEFRDARIEAGLSQRTVAAAARISRAHYSRIENGKIEGVSILDACRIASVLGLDASVQIYPGAGPLRDSGHLRRLTELGGLVRLPLRWRTEVPLPSTGARVEQRAWDAMIIGAGQRTAIEVEVRLRDIQALERRIALKRRDDPTDGFLLVVADTRLNRRILASLARVPAGLARLPLAPVIAALGAGEHPPSGLMLL